MCRISNSDLLDLYYETLKPVVEYWASRFARSSYQSVEDWEQDGWVILLELIDQFDSSRSGIKTWATLVLRARFCNLAVSLGRQENKDISMEDIGQLDGGEVWIVERVCVLDHFDRLWELFSPCARYLVESRLLGMSYSKLQREAGWSGANLKSVLAEIKQTCEQQRDWGLI